MWKRQVHFASPVTGDLTKFGRGDASSPAPATTLAQPQQNQTQTHHTTQQTFLNPALPPGYSYTSLPYYTGVPGLPSTFQYGPAVFPVSTWPWSFCGESPGPGLAQLLSRTFSWLRRNRGLEVGLELEVFGWGIESADRNRPRAAGSLRHPSSPATTAPFPSSSLLLDFTVDFRKLSREPVSPSTLVSLHQDGEPSECPAPGGEGVGWTVCAAISLRSDLSAL